MKIKPQTQVQVPKEIKRARPEQVQVALPRGQCTISVDSFEPAQPGRCGTIGWWPPPKAEKPTLNAADRKTATRLAEALEKGPRPRCPTKPVEIRMGSPARGPEGEPLVQVSLKGGKIGFVDPNTNQFYLAKDPNYRGDGLSTKIGFLSLKAQGPMPLPKGVQFTNSHFSDADARELTRIANGDKMRLQPMPIAIEPAQIG